MNRKNPDQQQNRGERPQVHQEQDASARKAEIKKAVEEDDPDNKSEGQDKVGYSGGTLWSLRRKAESAFAYRKPRRSGVVDFTERCSVPDAVIHYWRPHDLPCTQLTPVH
jgi:hypothetical protein